MWVPVMGQAFFVCYWTAANTENTRAIATPADIWSVLAPLAGSEEAIGVEERVGEAPLPEIEALAEGLTEAMTVVS